MKRITINLSDPQVKAIKSVMRENRIASGMKQFVSSTCVELISSQLKNLANAGIIEQFDRTI